MFRAAAAPDSSVTGVYGAVAENEAAGQDREGPVSPGPAPVIQPLVSGVPGAPDVRSPQHVNKDLGEASSPGHLFFAVGHSQNKSSKNKLPKRDSLRSFEIVFPVQLKNKLFKLALKRNYHFGSFIL